jgi:hypothetical protein
VRRRDDEQGLPVRRHILEFLDGDCPRGTGPVLDHDRLAELLAELGAEQAGDDVGRAACV